MTARERIIAAAVELCGEIGAAGLTMDQVAARANVSKGGLLYHFASKEALLGGMIEGFMQRELSRIEARAAKPADFPRAYVESALEPPDESPRLISGLIAAAAGNPELLQGPKEFSRQVWRRMVEAGLSPARAAIVCLAVDGWIFGMAMGHMPWGPDDLPAIRAEYLRLLDPSHDEMLTEMFRAALAKLDE